MFWLNLPFIVKIPFSLHSSEIIVSGVKIVGTGSSFETSFIKPFSIKLSVSDGLRRETSTGSPLIRLLETTYNIFSSSILSIFSITQLKVAGNASLSFGWIALFKVHSTSISIPFPSIVISPPIVISPSIVLFPNVLSPPILISPPIVLSSPIMTSPPIFTSPFPELPIFISLKSFILVVVKKTWIGII